MNSKRFPFNLVVGVWALGLIVLAAYMPGSALAATVVSFDADPAPMSTYCYDAVDSNLVALGRKYGTFAGVWTNMVNPDLVALDRNYGTFAGVWTNCAPQVASVSPGLRMASYPDSPVMSAEAEVLAANPELMIARRYVGPVETIGDGAFLAANPELMLAHRYIGSATPATDAAFLAVNPELVLTRR